MTKPAGINEGQPEEQAPGTMPQERGASPNAASGSSAVDAHHSRLGQLLVWAGLVPADAVERALKKQVRRNERLGTLLLEMGMIDERDLNLVLEFQRDLRARNAEALVGFVGSRLGSILVQSALVSEWQLQRALKEQEKTGAPLGDILVRNGAISREVRDGALAFQQTLHSPTLEQFRLGRMLVNAGLIDEETLQAAIQRQQASAGRLGETLVGSGAITHGTLNEFLVRQRRIISAALMAVSLLGAGAPLSEVAAAGVHQIQVAATVLRHVSISGLRVPAEISLSAADVERGYVDVAQGFEVDIRSNNPTGVMLGISVKSTYIRAAHLAGLGKDIDVGGTPVTLAIKAQGQGLITQTLHFSIRFELSSDAAPGVMQWPLKLFVAPA